MLYKGLLLLLLLLANHPLKLLGEDSGQTPSPWDPMLLLGPAVSCTNKADATTKPLWGDEWSLDALHCSLDTDASLLSPVNIDHTLSIAGAGNISYDVDRFKSWDWKGLLPSIELAPGTRLCLSQLHLTNVTLDPWAPAQLQPGGRAAPPPHVAQQQQEQLAGQSSGPLGILHTIALLGGPLIVNNSAIPRVVLQNVLITTSCATLAQHQATACNLTAQDPSRSSWLLVSLGSLLVVQYQDEWLRAVNVTITCPSASDKATAPPIACASNIVDGSDPANTDSIPDKVIQTWATGAEVLYLYVENSINYIGISDFSNIPVAFGNGALGSLRALYIIAAGAKEDNGWTLKWDVEGRHSIITLQPTGQVVVQNYTLVNLPVGPVKYAPLNMLTALLWTFTVPSGMAGRAPLVLMQNCSLVVPPDEMVFWDMALTSLVSAQSSPPSSSPPPPSLEALTAFISWPSLSARPLSPSDPSLSVDWGVALALNSSSSSGSGSGSGSGSDLAAAVPAPRPWLLQRLALPSRGLVLQDVRLLPGKDVKVTYRTNASTSGIVDVIRLPDGSLGNLANVAVINGPVAPVDLLAPAKPNGLAISAFVMAGPVSMAPSDWLPPDVSNGGTSATSNGTAAGARRSTSAQWRTRRALLADGVAAGSSSGSGSSSTGAAWQPPVLDHPVRVVGDNRIARGRDMTANIIWDMMRLPAGVLGFSGNGSISFEQLTIVNVGVAGSSSGANGAVVPAWLQPLASYTLMLWAFGLDRSQHQQAQQQARVLMTDSSILAPVEEFQVIQDLALRGSTDKAVDPRAVQLLLGFLKNASVMETSISGISFIIFEEIHLPGILGRNLQLQQEQAVDGRVLGYKYVGMPDGSTVLVPPGFQVPPAQPDSGSSSPPPVGHPSPPTSLVPPTGPGSGSGSGSELGSETDGGGGSSSSQAAVAGAAVGGAVGGSLLLGLLAVLLVVRARRKRQQGQGSSGGHDHGHDLQLSSKVHASGGERGPLDAPPGPPTASGRDTAVAAAAAAAVDAALATRPAGPPTRGVPPLASQLLVTNDSGVVVGIQSSAGTAEIQPAANGLETGPPKGRDQLHHHHHHQRQPSDWNIASNSPRSPSDAGGAASAATSGAASAMLPVPPVALVPQNASKASSVCRIETNDVFYSIETNDIDIFHSMGSAATATAAHELQQQQQQQQQAGSPRQPSGSGCGGSNSESNSKVNSSSQSASQGDNDNSKATRSSNSRQTSSQAAGSSMASRPMDELRQLVSGMALASGDRLVIQKMIGKGGFGCVYKGRWRNLDVAVKTISFVHLDDSRASASGGEASQRHLQKVQDAKKRALVEAAVCSAIVHPNVVTTYHYDVAQTPRVAGAQGLRGMEIVSSQAGGSSSAIEYTLYLVQEFCNTSLADAIEKGLISGPDGQPNLEVVLHIVGSVACAMAYIHSQNIIHGDLKPDNILLKHEIVPGGEAGTPPEYGLTAKVCDFGLCALLDDGRSHISGVVHGTPFYVPPEIMRQRQATRASDVFAMGVIMWEAYTGNRPWVWVRNEDQQGGGSFRPHPQLGTFPPHCPAAYSRLALSCFYPDPAKRPTFQDIFDKVLKIQAALPG